MKKFLVLVFTICILGFSTICLGVMIITRGIGTTSIPIVITTNNISSKNNENEEILHDALCGQVCMLRVHENMILQEKEAGKEYGTINLSRINEIQKRCYEIKKYIESEKKKYRKETGKNFDGKCECHLESD